MSDLEGMEEILEEFLVESYENLDALDRDLVELEEDSGSSEILGRIFRTIHTIKGTSGFLAFTKLEKVTHVGENLLSLLRDGKLQLTPEITTALLQMVDAVRQMLSSIEATQAEGDTDYSALVEKLTALKEGRPPEEGAGDAAPAPSPAAEEQPAPEAPAASADAPAEPAPAAPAASDAPAEDAPAEAPAASDGAGDAAPPPTPPAPPSGGDAGGKGGGKPAPAQRNSVSGSSIRVGVGLLDDLMNLVGELVLVRNQILQVTSQAKDNTLTATSQRLNLITTELQEGVMKTRMQPIGSVWSKFPRVVRDLALACGKKVRIEMEGKETELDKTIIEAIKDPLTHAVRNAVDHGVEGPEERAAAGKPEEGCLFLSAYHEGGQVNIEISDNGAGIDPEKIKAKAISKGVVSPDEAGRMNERSILNLIFAPGFSTAAQVTNVSGRGVGMDVVKTNIEKIGGTVDIQSRFGQGTTLKIKIPLTLAIIPALTVTTDGDRYAIPQISLLELVRLAGEDAHSRIEMLHGAPVYRLRGKLLPLVYLADVLGAERYKPKEEDEEEVLNIVVLHADERQFGLVVEGIHDTEEIVVKPLGNQLKGIKEYAGTTIMGDGKVALILDVVGIAQTASVVTERRGGAVADMGTSGADGIGERKSLLVFRGAGGDRMAFELSTVARLEKIERSGIELSGGQEVVQYRGDIMPLIPLSDLMPSAGFGGGGDDDEMIQVVVYGVGERNVGLVVDEILDIVEEVLEIQTKSQTPGVLGKAVVQSKVTEILDLDALMEGVIQELSDSLLSGT